MAGRKQSILLSVAAMAVVLVGVCSAATYNVGDTTGWDLPPSSASTFYSNWASQHTFQAGDVLVFNFTRAHTVAPVSKASYDSCNSNNPLSAPITASPARITLTAGTHYYLCTTQGHCTLGQKLAVTVTGPSSSPGSSPQPTTAPPPNPRPTATPSPPPTPTAGATPPAAGGPSVPTTPDAGTPPPAGNFAAPTAAGVSLLSLVSVAAAAAFLF